MSTDWNGLRNEIESAIKNEVNGVIEGGIADLEGPIRDAANRMVVAIRRGPTAQPLVDEIRDELSLRMLEKQIKAKAAVGNVLDVVLGIGLNLLFKGAVGALGSVKAN
jgi:hypothetical protein